MKKLFIIFLFLGLFSSPCHANPVLLFSDLTSGPATGNGATDKGQTAGVDGAFVTVWGYNLGTSQGTSIVTTGGVTANTIYQWGDCASLNKAGETYENLYDSHKMQWICFQVPSTATSGAGTISVTVNGETSNTLPFTVRTGNIYFVDASASGAGTGTYSDPWQSPASYVSALASEDGAILYYRAGVYANTEYANTKTTDKALFYAGSGMAGTESNPNAMIGYPGEVASLEATYGDDKDDTGYYQNIFKNYPYFSWEYLTVSKLRLEANTSITTMWTGFRFVGNLTIAGTVHNSGTGHFGGGWKTDDTDEQIDGAQIYGNIVTGATVADKQDHAIYFGCAKNMDAGWNYIYDNSFEEGPIFSTNVEPSSACPSGECLPVVNLQIHDNVIDMSDHPSRAIGFFEQKSGSYAYVYNNIIIGPSYASNSAPGGYQASGTVYWYNNVFYNIGHGSSGILDIYEITPGSGITYNPTSIIRNNIFYANADNAQYYIVADDADNLTISNNCYYGIGPFSTHSGGDATAADTNSYDGDPLFTTNGSDFTLQTSSPLNPATNPGYDTTSIVSLDFAGVTISTPVTIGAYQYGETAQATTGQCNIGQGKPTTIGAGTAVQVQ